MGICDLIPGISGGTIAFITGIYERLIYAVKGFSLKILKNIGNIKKFKKDLKKLDLVFLTLLGAGIATSILIGSRIMDFLLENYFSFTIAFFIGLIIASSKIIFDNIKKHSFTNMIFGIIGMLIGGLMIFISPASVNPSMIYIFIGGFLAISAMFLPGISGAFILFIMGLYEFIIKSVKDLDLIVLNVFFVGAILGAASISRVVAFLFLKDRCKTLYFLLGFVIGALSIPLKRIIQPMNIFDIIVIVLLVILSMTSVLMINKKKRLYDDNKKRN